MIRYLFPFANGPPLEVAARSCDEELAIARPTTQFSSQVTQLCEPRLLFFSFIFDVAHMVTLFLCLYSFSIESKLKGTIVNKYQKWNGYEKEF